VEYYLFKQVVNLLLRLRVVKDIDHGLYLKDMEGWLVMLDMELPANSDNEDLMWHLK
tara:strand:+ start:577 stop:747 length:171 start_codon:yes stop_codon:yes gene_type:complete